MTDRHRIALAPIPIVCLLTVASGCRRSAPPAGPTSQPATAAGNAQVPATVLAEIREQQELLQSDDLEEAVRAIDHLGRMRGVDVSETLLAALDDPRPLVRERAVLAVARTTGRQHALRLADLLRHDESPYVRAAAVTVLGRTWACDQMPDILDALDDDNPDVRQRAAAAATTICGVQPGFEETDPAIRRKLTIRFYRAFWKNNGPSITRYHQVHNDR